LLPVKLRDEKPIWAFTRYSSHPRGIWERPGRHTLKYQLSDAFLARLTEWGGFAILYTHLGLPLWDGESPLFDADNLAALRKLKARSEAGAILVAATSRILDYWVLNHFLNWTVEKGDGGRLRIRIDGIDDPVAGRRDVNPTDLEGLAFYTPSPDSTYVELNGQRLTGFKTFDPDHSGSGGIHLPWRRLEPPADRFEL